MSFKSNEERISDLENQVKELVKINSDIFKIVSRPSPHGVGALKAVGVLGENQLSTLRYIFDTTPMHDVELQKQMKDKIERLTSQQDVISAMIRDCDNPLPPPATPAPPAS